MLDINHRITGSSTLKRICRDSSTKSQKSLGSKIDGKLYHKLLENDTCF